MEEEVVAHGAEGGLTFHPLDQFMLRPLFGGVEEGTLYNPWFFSITNATLWMALAVLAIFAPSGLGVREASMYGLLLAVTTEAIALGATVLNRLAITLVEALLVLVGAILIRRGRNTEEHAGVGAPTTESAG